MKRLIPFFAYTILILVVFWPVLWPPDGMILFGPDITRYHYWQRQFLGNALREGSVPWWNPFIMAGVPYLEHPQIPVWYPLNLLFVLLSINVAVSWYIAIHLLLAMTGMYLLLRSLSSLRTPGSSEEKHWIPAQGRNDIFAVGPWLSGVAFGFSAYFVARIPAGHIDIIAASSWLPLVFGAFWKLISAHPTKLCSSIILSAVVLAMQLLAGHPMVAVYTLEAVLIVTLLRMSFPRQPEAGPPLAENRESIFQPLIRTVLAVLLGLGIAAVQLLPNAQFVSRSIRTFPFPDAWAQLGTPTVGHLLEFLDPYYFYSRLPDSGFGFEHVGYIGKVSLLFAVVAVVSWVAAKKKRWEVPAFLLIAVFGIWMWLGSNAPIDLFSWVRSWMPLYSQIRIPARHIVLFVLAASALFGLGLNLVRSKAIQLIVIGLLLVDLIPLARHHLSLVPVPERAEDPELVSILTKDKSLFRFLPNFYHGDPLRDVLEFNAPIGRRLQSVSGYDTPPLRGYWEFLLAVNGYQFSETLAYSESVPPFRAITSPYLNFLNVKYVLEPMHNDSIKQSSTKQFALVKENPARGWRLYENENVMPRFFIATTIQKETNRERVLAAIGKVSVQPRQGSVDPHTTIIVDGSAVDTSGFAPDCPAGYEGTVGITSYRYGRIELTSTNSCNAFLGSSEVMYPGWTAKIDGKETSVFEGNAAFRTVYLPRGAHRIEFSYRPGIVVLGGAVSFITIAAVTALLLPVHRFSKQLHI